MDIIIEGRTQLSLESQCGPLRRDPRGFVSGFSLSHAILDLTPLNSDCNERSRTLARNVQTLKRAAKLPGSPLGSLKTVMCHYLPRHFEGVIS